MGSHPRFSDVNPGQTVLSRSSAYTGVCEMTCTSRTMKIYFNENLGSNCQTWEPLLLQRKLNKMSTASRPSLVSICHVFAHLYLQLERIPSGMLHVSRGQITAVSLWAMRPYYSWRWLFSPASRLLWIVTRTGSYLSTQAGIQLFNWPLHLSATRESRAVPIDMFEDESLSWRQWDINWHFGKHVYSLSCQEERKAWYHSYICEWGLIVSSNSWYKKTKTNVYIVHPNMSNDTSKIKYSGLDLNWAKSDLMLSSQHVWLQGMTLFLKFISSQIRNEVWWPAKKERRKQGHRDRDARQPSIMQGLAFGLVCSSANSEASLLLLQLRSRWWFGVK